MSNKFSVLIPDSESLLIIYVVNCLCLIDNIKIYVLSNTKYSPIRSSRHIHHFSYFPKTDNPLEWISRINQEVEYFNIDIVMPIFEDAISTVLQYKEYMNQNKLVVLPDLTNFQTANNKWLLAEHLRANNIPHPKTSKFLTNISSQNQVLMFPLIIKPTIDTGGGKGVSLIKNEYELNAYTQTNISASEVILQEYIEGYDVGCSVLCKEGSILAYTIQKAAMLEKNPFKPLLEVEFIYSEALLNTVKKLMESLNWSGVAHIDLRYDKSTCLFKVLEINPRFWGSLNASMAAGVNFPHLYCIASLDQSFKLPEYNQIKFLNLKGLVFKSLKNMRTLFNAKYILNHTEVRFMLNDPAPIFLKYVLIIKLNIVSMFKRFL